MDKTYLYISTKALRVLTGGLALLALLVLVAPQAAQASTASNTVIRNTVTVNYKDTAGTSMTAVTDTIDITVSLVASQPTLSAPADGTTDPATDEVYTYTITSTANGPDTYALTADDLSHSAGIGDSDVTLSTASIILGATTAAAAVASGNATITVPNDAASNASINGIEDGDTLVIDGNAYTVDSITDNGGTVGETSTIVLSTNLTTNVDAGELIYERKTFTVTVDPGTVSAAANQTITVTTSADGSSTNAATEDETITTVQVASLTVTKEVSANGTVWSSADTSTFTPADTIYFRITVTNGGSSNATSVVLTDAQPAYTTYVGGRAYTASGTGNDYGTGTLLTDANAGDDGYDFNVTTANTATYSIGTIASGATVQFFFRVTVN